MSIKAVDLFCGVGGLTCGIQQTGIEVIAGIDLDKSCEYAYEYNNKSKFLHESVDKVNGQMINDLFQDCDTKILMGCAPCQPFSNHQKDKQNRSVHKDWGLLYEFGRVVEESMPDIVSMENVPELRKEKVFNDFVYGLIFLGYNVNFKVVNAADYGVPQRRRRLLLLASLHGNIELIAPTHSKKHNTVYDAISNLPKISAGETCEEDVLHRASRLSNKNLQRIHYSVQGGTWRDWPSDLVLDCHKKEQGATYSSVYGRMKWNDVSPTITTQFHLYGTGRFGHPEQDRAISLREGAILQSFPKDYKFVEHDDVATKDIAKHIGNAVPPLLGKAIGLSIKNFLNIS